MSEAWERWRIALVPLGVATVLIGAVWAFTGGGSAAVDRATAASTSASAARARATSTPEPGAPTTPPAPSTNAVASAAPPAASEDAGPPQTTAVRLANKRAAATKLKETYLSRIARAQADAVDLDRLGKHAEAAKRRDEAANLKKLVDEANRDIADYDTMLDGGVVDRP